MKIKNIDHIVLTVRSIEVSAAFYESLLGMVVELFAGDRVALKFGDQKINLHELGCEFEPKASRSVLGSADLCFITEETLEQAMAHVRGRGVEILEGPVARTGACGEIISFYFRDPDENLIEVAVYPELS